MRLSDEVDPLVRGCQEKAQAGCFETCNNLDFATSFRGSMRHILVLGLDLAGM